VKAGDIHYYIASGGGGFGGAPGGGGFGGRNGGAPSFAGGSAKSGSSAVASLFGNSSEGAPGSGGLPGARGGGFGGRAAGGAPGGGYSDSAITEWVQAHFKKQTIGGQTVYNLTERS